MTVGPRACQHTSQESDEGHFYREPREIGGEAFSGDTRRWPSFPHRTDHKRGPQEEPREGATATIGTAISCRHLHTLPQSRRRHVLPHASAIPEPSLWLPVRGRKPCVRQVCLAKRLACTRQITSLLRASLWPRPSSGTPTASQQEAGARIINLGWRRAFPED